VITRDDFDVMVRKIWSARVQENVEKVTDHTTRMIGEALDKAVIDFWPERNQLCEILGGMLVAGIAAHPFLGQSIASQWLLAMFTLGRELGIREGLKVDEAIREGP